MALIGLLGGTFDPIHNGHIHIGKAAKSQLNLDKIIYIPNGTPPHKAKVISDGLDRFNMTSLAIQGLDGFSVSDYEIKKTTPGYSVETVSYFKNEFPDDEFVFIMGEDSLDYIDKWYKPEVLLKMCRFAVVIRGGFKGDTEEKIRVLKEEFGADVSFVKCEGIEISSSEIRKRITEGKCVDDFLNAEVITYIKKRGLYIRK